MSDGKESGFNRRRFIQATGAMGLLQTWYGFVPAFARPVAGQPTEIRVGGDRIGELFIDRTPFQIGQRQGTAVTINGTVPGPLLRFKEGETVTLRVTNRLDEPTSIHWHGLLVPSDMDGVPGISFPGIAPGETFTYRYHVRQSGTYWYHSHSAFQEQQGHYAPLIIDPAERDPVSYDREHVVMLSDWTFEHPERVFSKLKKQADFYNFQQRTAGDFMRDAKQAGIGEALKDRMMWAKMRMSPSDILDITGYTYTYLVNGMPPGLNWTALFRPGERVRLRFINAAASTFFNVRIPGLRMTVVQADGQNVQPVAVEEFQIGVAETYDVIVQPQDDQAYTIFAETIDRSGFARGTLAPRQGMTASVPPLRERPLRSMVDMGMDMDGMDHGGNNAGGDKMQGMAHGGMEMKANPGQNTTMPGMDHGTMQKGMDHSAMQMGEMTPMRGMESPIVARHGPNSHGVGNATVAQVQRNRLGEPGVGLENVEHRVLTYNDLKNLMPAQDTRMPSREIEMHLTGNMEQFIWGIDGEKFSEAPEPERVRTGERVRLTMVNDTMMEHPMHLHGVFMELVNGAGAHKPRKHTVIVKPAERLSVDFTFDEPGNFVFHCHMLYHMEAGMFRFFNVSGPVLWSKS